MSENINKTDTAEIVENPNGKETAGKTFTQEEVNRIVSDRLGRERDKRAAELDEREKAVKARELAVIAAEKLAAAGLPKDLTAVLKYDDEAELDAAIEKLSNIKGLKNTEEKGALPKGFKCLENRLPDGLEYPDDSVDIRIKKAFQPLNE